MDRKGILNKERLVEALAVALNLSYTWLYIHENPLCWYLAAVGSALFTWLCWKKRLYAETALQLFYVGFAFYGMLLSADSWNEAVWDDRTHLLFILAGMALTVLSGRMLKLRTNAALPYLDSFTTVFSLIATWVMVNFVHENWLYWLVIDSVSIVLYLRRGLYFGSVQFLIYLLLAIEGYWRLGWF